MRKSLLVLVCTVITFPLWSQPSHDARTGTTEDVATAQARGVRSISSAVRIWQPTVISQPGKYVVVRNISTEGIVIEIDSSNVELDLNGFTLESTGDTGNTVQAVLDQLESVTIRNGTIRGGATCLFLDRIVGLTVTGITTGDCLFGVNLDDNTAAEVSHSRIVAETFGLLIDNCDSCRISDNRVVGGLEIGIGLGNGDGSEISRNQVMNSKKCIEAAGQGTVLRDNVVSNCQDGITLATKHGHIEGNVMSMAAGGLIFTADSTGNLFRGNTSRGNFVNFVDEGTDNLSNGDNYLPDRR